MNTDPRPAPIMPYVAGKRFYCERCGAGIFHETPNGNLECNGCGAWYAEDLPAKDDKPAAPTGEQRTFVLVMDPDIYISSGEFASREEAEEYFGPIRQGWALVEEGGPIEFAGEKLHRLEERVRALEQGIEQAVDRIGARDATCSASEKRAVLVLLRALLPTNPKR